MSALSKIESYLRSALAQKGLNLRGMPVIPKSWWGSLPHNREAYNQFILWIRKLELDNVKWVMDVGANHGDFSQAVSAVYPSAQVLLFEPMPTLQAELERRSRERGGTWRVMPCALGSASATATLYADPDLDAIGTLVGFTDEYLKTSPQVKPRETFTCSVRTLDAVCRECEIDQIDLLKIDVEGFEFEVLNGAVESLPKTKAVVIEVSLVRRDDTDQNDLVGMLRRLCSLGFHVVEIIPSLFSPTEPWKPVEFNLLLRRTT